MYLCILCKYTMLNSNMEKDLLAVEKIYFAKISTKCLLASKIFIIPFLIRECFIPILD